MTQKQLTTLVLVAFLATVGILAAFAIADAVRSKVSNPVEKALQGTQQPKK